MTTPDPTPTPSTPNPPASPKARNMLLLLGGGGVLAFIMLCVCSGVSLLAYRALAGGGSIVGRWKEQTSQEVWEFKSDGTCTQTDSGFTVNGTYATSGKQLTITLTILGLSNSQTYEYAVSGSELTLTIRSGSASQAIRFDRQ
jgi:hypothetical protein